MAHCIPHNKAVNNYLDDFLFIARTLALCNWLINEFLNLCATLGMPVNMSKTEWATQIDCFTWDTTEWYNYDTVSTRRQMVMCSESTQ